MVWGAFTANSKCSLVLIPPDKRTAVDFIEVVYDAVLCHYYYHHDNPEELILMEDGAPVHRSNLPKQWREAIGLTKLTWPANSPDLNPIENIWKICKDKVQSGIRPKNKEEMFEAVKLAWDEIPQDFFLTLLESMPARIKAVVDNKGGSTRW